MAEQTGIPGPKNTPTKYPTRVYKTRHYRKQAEALEMYSPSPLRSLSRSDNSPKPIPEDDELEIKSPIFEKSNYTPDRVQQIQLKTKYEKGTRPRVWLKTIGIWLKWTFLTGFLICSLSSMAFIIYGYKNPKRIRTMIDELFKDQSETAIFITNLTKNFNQFFEAVQAWFSLAANNFIEIWENLQNRIDKNVPSVEL